MENYWTRIINWLSENAPDMINNINNGANLKEIDHLNYIIDIRLPDDFIDFYTIHNGQVPYTKGLIDGEELLSIERIVDEWSIWKGLINSNAFVGIVSNPDIGIKNDWYNKFWIPITYDGAGNHYCIDLDPAEGGTKGQVIRVWHDNAQRSMEASSFRKWISFFVEDIEEGRYQY